MQPAAYHENDAAPIGAPRGMVSYSHADETETVTCLAQELRLRGATMLRDLEHFRAARATSASMADAISGDLVVAHLTENALQSVPVVERELKPALDRYANTGKPLVGLSHMASATTGTRSTRGSTDACRPPSAPAGAGSTPTPPRLTSRPAPPSPAGSSPASSASGAAPPTAAGS